MTPSNNSPLQLRQIGLRALPADLDDFLARATKRPLVPSQLMRATRAQAETEERSRRSMERRFDSPASRASNPWRTSTGPGRRKIERDVIERALTLDFLSESRNWFWSAATASAKP